MDKEYALLKKEINDRIKRLNAFFGTMEMLHKDWNK